MLKITLIQGGEDGWLLGELFFWVSVEHALIRSVSGIVLGGLRVYIKVSSTCIAFGGEGNPSP